MSADPTPSPEAEPRPAPGAVFGLSVLTLVYVLNFLDRTLIYILFPPLKKELSLSDLQLALLGTTSFVIFYTLLGIPFGRLADRVSRKRLIAGGLALWSVFSGLTAFADSFLTVFLCRVMVGVGEATLGPAALSLLSDWFPPKQRATVSAIYSAGIPVGAGLAFFLGGAIGESLGWRWAFAVLSFPGLVVALVVLGLNEAERGRTEQTVHHASSDDWRTLLRSRPLLLLFAGYAFFCLAANSLSIWGAIFFVRYHGLSLTTIGVLAGILSLVGGVPGTVLGGWAADRFRRSGPGGRLRFSALCALACAPLWLLLLYGKSTAMLVVVNLVLLGAALMWLGPAAADVHEISGPKLRGLGIGLYFFTAMIAGYGLGPPLIGRVSDALGPGHLREALLVSPACSLIAALLLWIAARAREREAAA